MAASALEGRVRGVTPRALLLGAVLIPFNVYWVLAAELRWYLILTLNPLFVTPVFYLLLLAGLNGALRRLAPSKTLSGGELVTVYAMLVMSCTIATHDFIINLMTVLPWPRWFASPTNNWENTIFQYLPKWMFVWDRNLIADAMKGGSSLYRREVLLMWIKPLAVWSLFILCIGWTMLCLNVILRRAWIDETRLAFPIVRLPMVLTQARSESITLRSSALWMGFALAAGIDIVNGLQLWFPWIPHFTTRAQPLQFPTPPWNATAPLFVTWYPFAIGLAFLVPLDVSFSCWFFYLFVKLQAVLGSLRGYSSIPDFPYVSEQGIGAWYAFGLALVYGLRGYLAQVIRIAVSRDHQRDRGEPMSYRTALIGLFAGCAFFVAFWYVAGMNILWVLVVLVTYLLLSMSITRARAEAGGQHTVWDLEPMRLCRLFDSRMIGPATLATAAVSHWYWRLNRSHVMPSQLEIMKLGQEHGMKLRSLVLPMLGAIALATICAMWACLHIFYTEGATAKCQGFAVWTGVETFDWLNSSVTSGFRAEPGRWWAIGGSALFVVFLTWMRTRFAGFPFHPLGYCIGPGLMWLWCPFLVAWLCKLVILRYGGLKLYRRTLPFFLGLVLGDYTTGAVWSLIGVFGHVPSYNIFH
jgi:hypothetical protein